MEINALNTFNQAAQNAGVLFYYTGGFSQSIVTAMSDMLKHKLQANGVTGSTARKIFSAFVEMAQNVVHYSEDRVTDADAVDREVRYGTMRSVSARPAISCCAAIPSPAPGCRCCGNAWTPFAK
ncbi:DUF6272 family protein [Methylogaea oryzae]|uniref:DUF6272 family protein n=1 Tax=Methylogaea oryzae TaxID=1295382 RepID=UPI0006D170C9|nr:DUF6272 family protein [Methylogaea oryzae]